MFPNNLKLARVTCIFKSGDQGKVSNYRPISVLNIFSNILEKLVVTRLVQHFTLHSYFSPEQFGFRQGLSTEDAVQQIVCPVYDALDEGSVGVGAFLDLAKAFDSLDRRILLDKLSRYGIVSGQLNWFRSYFEGRTQCVAYNGELSSVQPVNFGVVQGSLLGPTLFIIYIFTHF